MADHLKNEIIRTKHLEMENFDLKLKLSEAIKKNNYEGDNTFSYNTLNNINEQLESHQDSLHLENSILRNQITKLQDEISILLKSDDNTNTETETDDTEIENTSWLTEMVSSIQQPSVGIVGCKLLYSNRKVQHGGVIIGIGDFAGHAFRHLDEDADVMGCRLHLKQNYSAVTAACMLIKSDIFREVNGFDEVNLPTS